MGLAYALQWTGRHGVIEEGDRAKQPDNGFRPRHPPRGRSGKWPAVVLEVAYTESAGTKLARDLEWWITRSRGDVKAAIGLLVSTASKEIVLERWEMDPREGARCQQRVVISQPVDKDVVVVTNAPLTIRFESFMLRSAERGEGDIVMTEDDLKLMAQLIWQTQGFDVGRDD